MTIVWNEDSYVTSRLAIKSNASVKREWLRRRIASGKWGITVERIRWALDRLEVNVI